MIVYHGKVFDLERRRKAFPDGSKADIDMIVHNGAAVILPVRDERMIFVREYRPVVDRWLYELPAGTIEMGEKPKECAVRELREETGFIAKTMKPLFSSFSAPGLSTEKLHFFVASGLKKRQQELDDHEVIKICELPIKSLVSMIRTGRITDGKTVQGILYYHCFVE